MRFHYSGRCQTPWRISAQAPLLAALMRAVMLLGPLSIAASVSASGPEILPPEYAVLPELPGPFSVATAVHEVVDDDRLDPLSPVQAPRSLVVQVWYPARTSPHANPAPYMTEAVAGVYEQSLGLKAGALSRLPARASADGQVLAQGRRWPVVLFSPGRGISRSLYTVALEGLASEGFVVLAIDHPYDARVVQFPDGRVVEGLPPPPPEQAQGDAARALAVRLADLAFVIDRLPTFDALLEGALDVQRVGVFGHSLGGAAATMQMQRDLRVTACANLDGTLLGELDPRPVSRPLLLLSSTGHSAQADASWAKLWTHLTGFRRELQIQGATHSTYTDLAPLAVILGVNTRVPAEQLTKLIGPLDGMRSAQLELAYLTAFFQQTLAGRPSPLMRAPHPRYPEMQFVH